MKLGKAAAALGLVGAITFGFMWSWAVVEDGSWVFGADTLSELGRTDGGGMLIFNSGVIIASLLWLPFAYVLMRSLPKTWIGRIGSGMFLISAFALLAIGLFPIDTGTPHTIASWTFFVLALLSLLIMASSMLQSDVFGRIGTISSVVAALIPLALLLTTSVPLAEAVAVICLMVWASLMSLMLLFNWNPAESR